MFLYYKTKHILEAKPPIKQGNLATAETGSLENRRVMETEINKQQGHAIYLQAKSSLAWAVLHLRYFENLIFPPPLLHPQNENQGPPVEMHLIPSSNFNSLLKHECQANEICWCDMGLEQKLNLNPCFWLFFTFIFCMQKRHI